MNSITLVINNVKVEISSASSSFNGSVTIDGKKIEFSVNPEEKIVPEIEEKQSKIDTSGLWIEPDYVRGMAENFLPVDVQFMRACAGENQFGEWRYPFTSSFDIYGNEKTCYRTVRPYIPVIFDVADAEELRNAWKALKINSLMEKMDIDYINRGGECLFVKFKDIYNYFKYMRYNFPHLTKKSDISMDVLVEKLSVVKFAVPRNCEVLKTMACELFHNIDHAIRDEII